MPCIHACICASLPMLGVYYRTDDAHKAIDVVYLVSIKIQTIGLKIHVHCIKIVSSFHAGACIYILLLFLCFTCSMRAFTSVYSADHLVVRPLREGGINRGNCKSLSLLI